MVEKSKNHKAAIKIIAIDLQKEFTAPWGKCYKPRPSVEFIKNEVVPFLRKNEIKVAEIVSDYRQPRPGDRGDCNHPGTEAYASEIPEDVKDDLIWVKCMNSPIWTRKNIGDPDKRPGIPYQDPKSFIRWLYQVVGKPKQVDTVVLIGLTLDCCVLSAAQELNWQAYAVKVLVEGTDTYSGSQKEKGIILNNPPLSNWAGTIPWNALKEEIHSR